MTKRLLALSWRTKLVLLLLCFSIVPVLGSASYGHEILLESYQATTLQSLRALAEAKGEAIDQFTDIRRRDVERIATLLAPDLEKQRNASRQPPEPEPPLPKLKDAEELPTPPEQGKKPPAPKPEPPPAAKKPPGPVTDVSLRRTLHLILWDQRDFEELIVMDPQGRVVASTFGDHEGHDARALDYFARGRRATFVQPVFQSPITKELTMVISAPIRDSEGGELGVLAARLNLARFFSLINDTTGLGTSGETLVAKTIGKELVLMAPTRHDVTAALNRKMHLDAPGARPVKDAAQGGSGSGLAVDYRGVETYAAWRHVPSLGWGLVVKIDRSEATAPADAARRRSVLILAIIVLLIVPVSVLAANALVAPLRKLKNATDRLSRGDFAVQLDIDQRDEIGQLADSFERMVAAIKFFREQSARGDQDELDEEAVTASEPRRDADQS